MDCQTITEINLPDSVSEIGDSVFQGCKKLEKVKLPSELYEIEDYMFADCVSLKEIIFPKKIKSIGTEAFLNCITIEDLNLAQSISEINESAFDGCEGLNKINLPKDLMYIRKAAFRNCSSLIQVKMSNLVNYMGDNVFKNCNFLTDIVLSARIKAIPSQTFQGCSSLESIILPYQVETIEDNAFKNCTKLKKITIPKATTSISDSAFSYPDKMTIYGVAGSYAEQYAKENDIAFVAQQIATEKITLSETGMTLGRNEKYQLTAGLNPMDSTDEVIWSSSDEKIAKVDKTGNVEAISAGEAVITAKSGEKTAICKVTVNIPITSIYLNKTSIELNSIGDSYHLNASYYPSDADGAITWKSDDEGIASVDQTGKVTAVGKGTTTITVSCGKVKDTCTIVSKGESDGSQIIPSPSPQPSVKPNPDNQPANTPKPSMTPQVPTKGNIPQSSQTVNDGKNSGQMAPLTKIKGVVAKNQKKCKVKVTWKKVPNSLGYQIQYATNKKFKKAKKKTVKYTFVTLKKLKKKKTYFIRIRAYKIADGKKAYGKWSTVKKVKIKR